MEDAHAVSSSISQIIIAYFLCMLYITSTYPQTLSIVFKSREREFQPKKCTSLFSSQQHLCFFLQIGELSGFNIRSCQIASLPASSKIFDEYFSVVLSIHNAYSTSQSIGALIGNSFAISSTLHEFEVCIALLRDHIIDCFSSTLPSLVRVS